MTTSSLLKPGALSGVRVLDLSGSRNQYCGKLFADLGADVILVEPPGGCVARQQGPFLGAPGVDASIPFFYNNTNKRSLECDIEAAAGRELLRRLIANTDLLIETDRPGAMAARGLGYDDLRQLNPRLVYMSITPFGQTGPYVNYAADDLVLLALSGMLHMGGYADGAPQAMYGEQAYNAGSLFGAVAALTAVIGAERTGLGDYIDVSIHESIVMGLENAAQFYDLEKVIRPRAGGGGGVGGQIPCKDGFVYLMAGGVSGRKAWTGTVDWLISEGVANAAILKDDRWFEGDFRGTEQARQEFLAIALPFFMSHTREQLYDKARAARIPMAPVNTPRDVLASPQLAYREFFVDVPSQHLQREVRIPGAPFRLSGTPWHVQRAAPSPGQHTQEIVQELSA